MYESVEPAKPFHSTTACHEFIVQFRGIHRLLDAVQVDAVATIEVLPTDTSSASFIRVEVQKEWMVQNL